MKKHIVASLVALTAVLLSTGSAEAFGKRKREAASSCGTVVVVCSPAPAPVVRCAPPAPMVVRCAAPAPMVVVRCSAPAPMVRCVTPAPMVVSCSAPATCPPAKGCGLGRRAR